MHQLERPQRRRLRPIVDRRRHHRHPTRILQRRTEMIDQLDGMQQRDLSHANLEDRLAATSTLYAERT